MLVGVGVLFPWNMVISCEDFWSQQFPGGNALTWLSISFQTANVLGLLWVLIWGPRFTFQVRIVPGFFVYIACMAALPFVSNLGACIALCGVLGFFNSVVQGSMFGLTGLFSPRYMSAFMTGQGVAGIGVGILRIISKAALPADHTGVRDSTIIYFGIACLVVIACLFAYSLILAPSPVTQHFTASGTPRIRREFSKRQILSADTQLLLEDPINYGSKSTDKAETWTYWAVFKKIKAMALTVFFAFFVTLSLFPAITVLIKSTNPILNSPGTKGKADYNPGGEGWFPIITVVLFQLGDLIGRSIPNKFMVPFNVTWVLGIVRTGFVVLFVMLWRGLVFHNDIWVYSFMAVMAITNGLTSTMAMIYGTGDHLSGEEKEPAGTIMVFMLSMGLAGGTWFAKVIEAVGKTIH